MKYELALLTISRFAYSLMVTVKNFSCDGLNSVVKRDSLRSLRLEFAGYCRTRRRTRRRINGVINCDLSSKYIKNVGSKNSRIRAARVRAFSNELY